MFGGAKTPEPEESEQVAGRTAFEPACGTPTLMAISRLGC